MARILWAFLLFTLLQACSLEPGVPDFYLNTGQELSWEEKEPCTLKFDSEGDTISLPGRFKLRGGSSSKYFKHSFALELDEKYALAGLPKDDDWIINANYIDKTFMRHKLCYDLFREMGENNLAPKCAYFNLHLNNSYEGLYVLMEEVNGGFVKLDKGDTAAVICKDPPIFFPEKLDWVQDSTNYYQQKYPRKYIHDKTAYLESFMDFMYHAPDSLFYADIDKWVDIDNVIDWHLLLLFTNNGDGILKNFYLYKKDAKTPFRFAIWDYDHSFGRDGDYEYNMMDRPLDCNRAILLKRLMKSPYYIGKLSRRWYQLRTEGIFTVNHFKWMVYQNDAILRPYLKKNFEKWPLESEWYHDGNSYDEELEIMISFVELRIDQLDKFFSEIEPEHFDF